MKKYPKIFISVFFLTLALASFASAYCSNYDSVYIQESYKPHNERLINIISYSNIPQRYYQNTYQDYANYYPLNRMRYYSAKIYDYSYKPKYMRYNSYTPQYSDWHVNYYR